MDKKKKIEDSLAKNLPQKNKPLPQVYIDDKDIKDDYELSRETYRDLILNGTRSLDVMHELASESEHPRAFEVVQQTIGQLTTTNKELLNLHKTKKDIKVEKGGPTSVNNNLFVGSTAELQKMLKAKKDG